MANPELDHQAFQPFPKLGTAIADPETGNVTQAWYRLFITLWQRVGNKHLQTLDAGVIAVKNGFVLILDAVTGAQVGTIPTAEAEGGTPQEQVVGPSPFAFQAPSGGTLFIEKGTIQISRDGGTYYPVGGAGGSVPVQTGDIVLVTYAGSKPAIEFFPSSD